MSSLKNPRITPKERGLLKGAIRRVFSRSELRRKVMDAAEVKHFDPKRPRVTRWIRCAVCKELSPKYKGAADHIQPVIPVDSSFEEMSMDTVVDRLWCEEYNIQAICESCHKQKSRQETKLRAANKKRKEK